MNVRREYILKVIIAILISVNSLNTYANDVMGGQLTYTCIGQDSFLITLTYYRDCSGIPAHSQLTITISSTSNPGCGGGSLVLHKVPGTGADITPLCPGYISPCAGGSVPAVGAEEYSYQGIFVAPQPGCTYNLAYTNCCRNCAIDNIVSPCSQQIYLSAILESGLTPCNNSPQFLNRPVPYICINQPFIYNHGVYDPDGDSLHFSFVPCKTTGGANIAWQLPYTTEDPLPTLNGVTLHPQTGAIEFTPIAQVVAVMCIKVEEFRDGVKIGEVHRDMQIIVEDCKNPAPVAGAINGPFHTGSYDTTACPGQVLDLTIDSWDSNPFQSVSMSWNGGIPGATFNVIPGQHPTGNFSWKVPETANGLFTFTVMVQDDGCPLVATSVYTYSIEVREPEVTAMDTTICQGDTVGIVWNSSIVFSEFEWRTDNGSTAGIINPDQQNAFFFPTGPTSYKLTVSNGFCTAEDEFKIDLNPSPTITAHSETICPDGEVQISAVSDGNSFNWIPAVGLDDHTKLNPVASPLLTTVYTLEATNHHGCTSVEEVTITVQDLPVIIAGNDIELCEGETKQISAASPSANIIYRWEPASMVSDAAIASPEFIGTESVSLIVTGKDQYQCENTDTLYAEVKPTPQIDVTADTTLIKYGGRTIGYVFPDNYIYVWEPGGFTGSVVDLDPLLTTTYTISASDPNGCKTTDSITIFVIVADFALPMAFTPGSYIEANRTFHIITPLPIDIDYFRIYNRWGELIFETNDYSVGWDGTYNGVPQNPGSYTYVIRAYDQSTGEPYLRKGEVLLLR